MRSYKKTKKLYINNMLIIVVFSVTPTLILPIYIKQGYLFRLNIINIPCTEKPE